MNSDNLSKFVELDFNGHNRDIDPLINPVIPSNVIKLTFKVGLIIDNEDIRNNFYELIGTVHNYIISPFLSLFEIKVLYQGVLNQLVFFNPEYEKWPNHKISLNHIKGAHSLFLMCNLNHLSHTLFDYLQIISENRDLLNNHGDIPIFIVGYHHNEVNSRNNSMIQIKNIFLGLKLYFISINIEDLFQENYFRHFESFIFSEMYKQIYFSVLNKNKVFNFDSKPRLVWSLQYDDGNYYKIHAVNEKFSNSHLTIGLEKVRCLAHGGYLKNYSVTRQCSVCKGFYCEECYSIYQISEICFGSLLTKLHKVVLEEKEVNNTIN